MTMLSLAIDISICTAVVGCSERGSNYV